MMDARTEKEGTPAKKPKPSCKYHDQWDNEFIFLKKSRVGDSHAFCKICNCDFSIAHGGRNDVCQHEKSAKHKRGLEAQKHAQAMSAFVTRNATEADQVTSAEVKMAMLCAKNNSPFSFHDDFNKCVADMFPDSAIARKYSTGKTKATQHIKGAIAAELEDELAKTCRSQPFSLMCDESNNRKTDKEFVILTRLYDEATLQVATRFLEMPTCNVGNAENLYGKLSEALRALWHCFLFPIEKEASHGITFAFNSDNASVMKGRHNSVISRLKTSQPHIQDLGCICHLVQLATGCGIRAAQVPVEDILVGIYTHFDTSAKRCEVYKEFVPLREVEYGDGHQLADEDLFIGADTKAFMRSAELPVSAEKKIFQFQPVQEDSEDDEDEVTFTDINDILQNGDDGGGDEVVMITLPPHQSTRWNSFYDALARMCDIPVAELNTISCKFGMTAITEREHQFIREYCTVMKPLTVALDILQGEDNCFHGTLLPTVETLIFKTLELNSGLQILVDLPEAVVMAIKTRFAEVLESEDAVLAAVTLPKFKLRWLRTQDRKDKAKASLLAECWKLVLDQDQQAGTSTSKTNMPPKQRLSHRG
ncbi:AC9 transposase [Labeo rohita]|uniref:AC9 transposase n=1 Tax=Labeo rohita TaxID=84645 RepID=A0A498L780_LABRO|nr:AC9 transposase [Labeo rohita]